MMSYLLPYIITKVERCRSINYPYIFDLISAILSVCLAIWIEICITEAKPTQQTSLIKDQKVMNSVFNITIVLINEFSLFLLIKLNL